MVAKVLLLYAVAGVLLGDCHGGPQVVSRVVAKVAMQFLVCCVSLPRIHFLGGPYGGC